MANDESEIEVLRALVGPSETDYLQLRADLEEASSAVMAAEMSAGKLRGELAELSVQLARARQDQDTMQRRRDMNAGAYVADLGRELWIEVLRPPLARVARSVGVRRSR